MVLGAPLGCGDDDGGEQAADTVADTLAETPDQTSPPVVEQNLIRFKFNGSDRTLDANARADYVNAQRSLTISASKSLRKIEVNLLPIDRALTGTWTNAELAEVKVLICYDEGSAEVALDDCPDGFTHQSVAYDVTVAENGGSGGRVRGTFTATLANQFGDPFPLTDGVFDVRHR